MSKSPSFRWRWPALLVLVVVLGALLPGVQKASVPDNALTVWFLETDPQLQAYNQFHETFGNDEVILLCVHETDGVFQRPVLEKVTSLIGAIEEIDGVARVHSLFSMWDARREGASDVVFEEVVPAEIPDQGGALVALEERLIGNPLFRDRFISADGTRTVLWVQMDVMDDIDVRRDAIVDEVRATSSKLLGETEFAMGGIGVIYSGLNKITQHDFGLFIGIGYLMMFLALGLVFRSWRLVLAALGVITAGTIAALGVYGLLGHQLNMVTVVLPTLIIVLATADAVHFPAAYFVQLKDGRHANRVEVLTATLKHVLAPCVLTTVTTMAGFVALSSAPMAVIRHLGIFAAVGIGTALVACIILMVVALHGMPERTKLPTHGWIESVLSRVTTLLKTRPILLAGLSVAIFAAAVVGWTRVNNDTYTIGYLPEDHEVVLDHHTLEGGWGPYSPLDFSVTPAAGSHMDDPAVLAGLESFVRSAEELPEIRSGFSLHTVFRRMALVFDVAETEEMTDAMWAQLADLLRSQRLEWDKDDPEYLDNYLAPLISRGYREGRVTLVTQMMSARDLADLLDRLHGVAEDSFGEVATVTPNGYPPLYVKIIDYVMASQIRSFFLALAIIFTLMLVFLRSARLALISLVPNVFPVAVMMGMMGAMGIYLDIATATVAAIVIGVAIDDTVHFLYAWRKAERMGLEWEAAVEHTFRVAGRAAIITTTLLVVGFPVLMLGQVKTVFYFGFLTTIAAAAALYGDLVILPLCLRLFHKKASQ